MRLLTAHARADIGFLKDFYGILEVSLLYRGTEMLILTKNLAAYQIKLFVFHRFHVLAFIVQHGCFTGVFRAY